MSQYDYQAAIAAAQAALGQNSGEKTPQYTYPLVYPSAGQSIVVRLLFNPASGQIIRLVNRHEKTACYRTYGTECPICKVMQQVKDATGQDPFGRQKASRSRGLAFAQYVSSTQPIEKGNGRGTIQPGDLILFMFPWSVYSQINNIIASIAQTPTGMDQAFGHAQTGLFIQVSVTPDFKYTTTPNTYMMSPVSQTDEDFLKMLDGMESLYEQVLPSKITEEVDKQVKEYTDAIYRQYIAPRVPNAGVPVATAPQNYGQQIPTPPAAAPYPMPTSAPSDSQTPPWEVPQQPYGQFTPNTQSGQAPSAPQVTTTSSGVPACMGQHNPSDPKCIVCPGELDCISLTGSK